jgi:hypothetical protein
VSKHGKMVKAEPAKSTLAKRIEQIRQAQHIHYEARKVLGVMLTEYGDAKMHASIVIAEAKQGVTDARIDLLQAKLAVLISKRAIRQAKAL